MEGVMDSKKIEVLNVKKLKNVNVSRQSEYSTHSEPHRPALRATYSII